MAKDFSPNNREELYNRYKAGCEAAGIPEHMQESIVGYILDGIPVGGFLTAVLENDLRRTVSRADWVNQKLIPEYVSFIFNVAPAGCHGSSEEIQNWVESGGLIGKLGMKRGNGA